MTSEAAHVFVAFMSVFILIKVMMALSAFSAFRVHTVRGTIRSAGY